MLTSSPLSRPHRRRLGLHHPFHRPGTACLLPPISILVPEARPIRPPLHDTLLDRDEVSYDTGHKAFLGSHARYMQQLASGNLMAVTRNRRLETALLDGVEHSRGAREFLDSLIDMERAFAEKIRMEQQSGLAKTPETLAALEAMKKRFFEDLHHRMETFFAVGATA